MKKLLLGSVAIAALAVSPALAADLPARPVYKGAAPVAVAAAYNWTGLYLGANCGGAWGLTTSSNTGPGFDGFDNGVATSYDNRPGGWTCGGQIGYNIQSGSIVFGVEGEFGKLWLDRRLEGIGTAGEDLVAVRYDWYATATGRLGIAWDRALLYVKGGAAWARIRNTASDLISFPPAVIDLGDFSEETHTRFGWALGGGLEYGLTPNWSLKGEYLYMDFGTYTTGLNLDGDTFQHRNQLHTAKIGINYRFGASPVVARY